jgi:hypothetical protein
MDEPARATCYPKFRIRDTGPWNFRKAPAQAEEQERQWDLCHTERSCRTKLCRRIQCHQERLSHTLRRTQQGDHCRFLPALPYAALYRSTEKSKSKPASERLIIMRPGEVRVRAQSGFSVAVTSAVGHYGRQGGAERRTLLVRPRDRSDGDKIRAGRPHGSIKPREWYPRRESRADHARKPLPQQLSFRQLPPAPTQQRI